MWHVFSFFLLTLLIGCNPQKGDVTINTSGIFNEPTYSINGKDASGKTIKLDDHLLTDDPLPLTVEFHNKTNFEYQNIGLTFSASDKLPPSIKFAPDTSGGIQFPGYEGTCAQTLAPQNKCTIKLIFAPREGRAYQEMISLSFNNMVSPETHLATIELLAGMPASLVFSNDETSYVFGEVVGIKETPVVERQDKITYTQILEVKNSGGIRAKNVSVSLSQQCISSITKQCPTDMGEVYKLENSCPEYLLPEKTCKMKLTYFPKNFDREGQILSDDAKEINYKSNVTIDYISDGKTGKSSLNAYFNSVSTNIQAIFAGSTALLEFDTPVISGNRESRSFQIKNNGYRSGQIVGFEFKEISGDTLATCKGSESGSMLECLKPDQTPVLLSEFPFYIKDNLNCLLSNGTGQEIEVGGICIFELVFQPSLDYIVNYNFDNLQLDVIYDSRWKSAQKIIQKPLLDFSAKSLSAARIIVEKVRYLGVDYTSPATNSPWTMNLGRLPLQSSNYFKRKGMEVTFKNVGSTNASNVSLKDGRNVNIPLGGSTSLGLHNPKYFTSVNGGTGCALIEPDKKCTISISFAAIGFNENYQESDNMFDLTDENSELYKSFTLTYKDGATYTDLNFSESADVSDRVSEARIKATLVRKGLLMELADDSRNLNNVGHGKQTIFGDEVHSYLYLTNIGTGPLPYIRLNKRPNDRGQELIPTTDPTALGADKDCLGVVDSPTGNVDFNLTAENRLLAGASFAPLLKDESCVYTFKRKLPLTDYTQHFNPATCTDPIATTAESILERSTRLANGEWEFCARNEYNWYFNWNDIRFRSYDGDHTAPGALSTTYGNRFQSESFGVQTQHFLPAKLLPSSFTPWLTAVLYRPPFALPMTDFSVPILFVEEWFFGENEEFYNGSTEDSSSKSPFIKAHLSKNFVETMSSFNPAGYDYVYYVGSFPKNSPTVAFDVELKNFGGVTAKTSSFSIESTDPAISTANSLTFPSYVASGQYITRSFNLATSIVGEKAMVLKIAYLTGEHPGSTLIYKTQANVPDNLNTLNTKEREVTILVLANITDTAPSLTLAVNDYEVVQNDGAPPTVTMLTPATTRALSINYQNVAYTVAFDSLKIQNTPVASDPYDLKKFTFTNNSLFPIHNLEIAHRSTATGNTPKPLGSSMSVVTSETTCTPGQILNTGESCSIAYKYQPRSSDTTDISVMTATYSSAEGEYFMQNIGLSFNPRSPGIVVPTPTLASKQISYKPTPTSSAITRPSYAYAMGSTSLTSIPMTRSITRTLGNSQPTKTSFLLTYHKYLQAHSLRGYSPTIAPATSVIPEASEYRVDSGLSYAKIWVKKYSDNSERLVFEASKGCFFGDDENNAIIPHYQKGFNSTTTTPCKIIMTLNMNFEYLLKNIVSSNGDDMRDNAAEIWYYSSNRSSTSSIWFHFEGNILPPSSVATGTYNNVESYDSPKKTKFYLPMVTVSSPTMGDIVGIRVIRSITSSGLNDPYAKTLTDYMDIPYVHDLNNFVQLTAGFTNGTFYYYKALAIRQDARFAHSAARFNGLSAGKYLSLLSNLTTSLRVLMPPINHHYLHTDNMIIEKGLTGGLMADTYSTASGRCTSRTIVLKNNNVNAPRSYTLMTQAIWDKVKTVPSANSYSNHLSAPHWLSNPKVTIESCCSGLPGYIPNQPTQLLDSSWTFYIRNGANPTAQVNRAVGGVPGSPGLADFLSYVSGEINFASARCQAILPP